MNLFVDRYTALVVCAVVFIPSLRRDLESLRLLIQSRSSKPVCECWQGLQNQIDLPDRNQTSQSLGNMDLDLIWPETTDGMQKLNLVETMSW